MWVRVPPSVPLNYSKKDCFFNKIKEYIASIEEIKDTYFFLLDGEVITSMERIINTKEKIKIIEQLDSWSNTVPNLFNLYLPLNNDTKFKEELRLNDKTPKDVSGKFLYVQLDFRIMLIETKKIIQYINKYTGRNNFKISKEFFNNSNTSPLIGSGLLEDLPSNFLTLSPS